MSDRAKTARSLDDLIAARDGAKAADRVFQNIAFDILKVGREVPYLRDGIIHTGRIVEHGTKGEWWYWTMVWIVDAKGSRKHAINVIDIIRAIERRAVPA